MNNLKKIIKSNLKKIFFILLGSFFIYCNNSNNEKKIIVEKIIKKDTLKEKYNKEEFLGACLFDYSFPLSDSKVDTFTKRQGIYADIARAMAFAYNKKPNFYFEKDLFFFRPIRKGILAKQCELQFGLPKPSPEEGKFVVPNKVVASNTYMQLSYVFIVPKGTVIKNILQFKNKLIAFQNGIPPQATIFKIEAKYKPVLEDSIIFKLLDEKKVDAAFVWGPSAGYINKYIYNNKFDIYNTPFRFDVVIGVPFDKEKTLLPFINKQIKNLRPKIIEWQKEYGIYFEKNIDIPLKYR